jgi:hypothetical protein
MYEAEVADDCYDATTVNRLQEIAAEKTGGCIVYIGHYGNLLHW